jgi:hypothetical protein
MHTQLILERIQIFKGLSQEELDSIAQLCDHRKYKTKENEGRED